ncbi:aspartyl/asparaginyl beta-hydroxylase domain-containing protein (plasmid) [Rhizobium leguminosarum]
MDTRRAGRLQIDCERMAAELRRSEQFVFSDAYSEYLCGGPWKSCMLWAPDGQTGDGLVTNYGFESRPARTTYGDQLPYISGLIERHFNLDYLTFARLAVISNSVIIPHRDLLELGNLPEHARNAHRIHVPLVTNENCFFMHGNIVYQMRRGEVWLFDASSPHSAASFSPDSRIHLMIDFSHVDDLSKLVQFTPEGQMNIPPDSICRRSPMTDTDRKRLLALAGVIDMDNYRDVFSIVIKNHYRKDGGDNSIWSTFLEIARSSANTELREKVDDLHRYFLIERAA